MDSNKSNFDAKTKTKANPNFAGGNYCWEFYWASGIEFPCRLKHNYFNWIDISIQTFLIHSLSVSLFPPSHSAWTIIFSLRNHILNHKSKWSIWNKFLSFSFSEYAASYNYKIPIENCVVDPVTGYYFCMIGCGRSYKSYHTMTRHMKFECSTGKKFECDVCKRRFSHKHHLKNHRMGKCFQIDIEKFTWNGVLLGPHAKFLLNLVPYASQRRRRPSDFDGWHLHGVHLKMVAFLLFLKAKIVNDIIIFILFFFW